MKQPTSGSMQREHIFFHSCDDSGVKLTLKSSHAISQSVTLMRRIFQPSCMNIASHQILSLSCMSITLVGLADFAGLASSIVDTQVADH